MSISLKFHEAIAVVLLNKPDRSATFEEVAEEINRRNLYHRKDQSPVPAYQIMQRTTLSNSSYLHLFEQVDKDTIKIKNV